MTQHIPVTLHEITAAAILHDIGKFIQRTRDPVHRDQDMENLCPFSSKYNHYTHLHVLYTSGFLKSKHYIFPDDMNPERVATLAAKHHQPDTPYQWIVAEADRLSSGCDRSRKEIEESENRYFEQPMRCIFDKISFEEDRRSGEHFYPLSPLVPSAAFPTGKNSTYASNYRDLFVQFEKDFEKLASLKTEMFFQALDAMLEHYCWSIPSSTIDEPDISLYDHLRTTAALAAVLHKFHTEDKTIEVEEEIRNRSKEKFLLVSGDLTGIQNYIFDIRRSKFAAKILRAKSFELQVMMESVSNQILNTLELPGFCQVLNAGGRFLLLLPNNGKTSRSLEKIRIEVEEYCLQRFMGELSLNISHGVPISGKMLMQEVSGELFRMISGDVQQAKLTRFQDVLGSPEKHILDFQHDAFSGSQDECPLCGKRPLSGHDLCSVCRNLRDVGAALPKVKMGSWLASKNGPSDALSFPWKSSFRLSKDISCAPDDSFPAYINEYSAGFPVIRTPYHVPTTDSGEILTFEDIGENAKGASHIAMLKADVDNLGAIFTIGMKEKISLSRFATLSRMMNYFFTAVLSDLVEGSFPNIYIIYSGGDDLCLIGPWSDIVEFASELQHAFAEFSGRNCEVTISAGISLAHSGTPVLSITRETEKNLEASKKKSKNQCTVFGTTTEWGKYRELLSLASDWSEQVDKGRINLAIIYRLLEYSRSKKKTDKGNIQGINMLWKSHLLYDTTRNIGDPQTKERFLQGVIENIDELPIPVSVVLYQNRQGGKHEY